MHHLRTRPAPVAVPAALGIAAALLLTSCSAPDADPPGASGGPSSASAKPHGFVEGASEASEPQLRLLLADADGSVAVHDLLAAETESLDDVPAPEHAATDGRFLATSDGERTTIVDGGAWTVDHGDHTHYYDAAARVVGSVDGAGPVAIASSESTTTLAWSASGRAVALDRDALGQGEVRETATVDDAGVLLPLGALLVSGDAAGDRVRVLDAEGEPTGVDAACVDPAGGIVTRVGAVVGCADGAVLVTEDPDGGDPVVETVGVPAGSTLPRATDFANRTGRPTVAALAGDAGYWLLDTRERSWQHVPTDRPLRQVVAVDDTDQHVVALDADGRVLVWSEGDSAPVTTEPLVSSAAGATLQLDAQRAYLSDPEESVVHEVDFADDARVARSIDVPVRPDVLAEVGR
ncbi:ABC transporter [Curtobacterium sp. MCBD17_023]|uniref:ABC transporter n=1 Tax=Curtobacterium sp. MCBD17_023 TaxID=2175657 RepID=UPI000D8FAA3C|nr:ABC transporter [Curtobacterium sp. MCBD17_023]PYY50951.1 ABC transporter [Curtobacterium sp. MCBD17_023]